MRWQFALLKNACIGILPLKIQQILRTLKRKIIPNRVRIDTLLVSQGLKQIQMLRSANLDPAGKDCLEIGTGWAPVIPILLSLAGSRSVTLVDTQKLMGESSFLQTCEELKKHATLISRRLGISRDILANHLNLLSELNFNQALDHLNCRYLAPHNLIGNPLMNNNFDLIVSRAVFEHISPKQLIKLTDIFFDLLKKGGGMCHIIDNSDHWEHNDKQINRIHFLKYSKKIFTVLSAMNPLDYQNRLRHSQYISLFKRSGFTIVIDESVPDENTMKCLDENFKIHKDFKVFSKEDIAVLTSFILAKKE